MTRHFKPSTAPKPNQRSAEGKLRKARGANRVRIIGGQWRSRVIEFPDGEGLRPTANRVRETLFNWLGQTLHDQRCLDLFAGSGALGFEAASRGASEVIMVENSRLAMQSLKENQSNLAAGQCNLVHADARDFLARDHSAFDIIFVDPPFGSGLLSPLLAQLAPHLKASGLVYVECGVPLAETVSANPQAQWLLLKQGKAGAVHFGLLSVAEGIS